MGRLVCISAPFVFPASGELSFETSGAKVGRRRSRKCGKIFHSVSCQDTMRCGEHLADTRRLDFQFETRATIGFIEVAPPFDECIRPYAAPRGLKLEAGHQRDRSLSF